MPHLRPNPAKHKDLELQELPAVPWDDSWRFDEEDPVGRSSPMAIPQLGLAYQVDSTVAEVTKGSAADKAGIQAHDRIEKIALRSGDKAGDDWYSGFEEKRYWREAQADAAHARIRGSSVMVRYNPRKPEESVMEPIAGEL